MILAIDIGSGTQDILLYEEGERVENMVQLIVPSPTRLVAREIREATKKGLPICLTGHLMGGGPSVRAIKDHLERGGTLYSLKEPALTIKDNLEYVEELGVILVDEVPEGSLPVEMGDLCLSSLSTTLLAWGIEIPQHSAIAVQDHGFSTVESNRIFRFRHWERFLKEGGSLQSLVFKRPPQYLTRMKAIKEVLPKAVVMDTGAAAIIGSLQDETVYEAAQREGAVLINVGNQHTLGVLLYEERIYGIFEHHTSCLTGEKILYLIDSLKGGRLTNEEVFYDKGHGAAYGGSLPPCSFSLTSITGPRREMLKGYGLHMAAPHGDMMLTGCFGLVEGWREVNDVCTDKDVKAFHKNYS